MTNDIQHTLARFGMDAGLAETIVNVVDMLGLNGDTTVQSDSPAITSNAIISAVEVFFGYLHQTLEDSGYDLPKSFADEDIRHACGTQERIELLQDIIEETIRYSETLHPVYIGDSDISRSQELITTLAEDVFDLQTHRDQFSSLPAPANDITTPSISGNMAPHIFTKLKDIFAMPDGENLGRLIYPELNEIEPNFIAMTMHALAEFGYDIPERASDINWHTLYHNPIAMHAAYQVMTCYASMAREGDFDKFAQEYDEPLENPFSHSVIPTATLDPALKIIAGVYGFKQTKTPSVFIQAQQASLELITGLTPNNTV